MGDRTVRASPPRGVAAEDGSARTEAKHRLELLLVATELLGGSLDRRVLLQRLADFLVAHFADGCVIEMIDDGRFEAGGIAHRVPEKLSVLRDAWALRPEHEPSSSLPGFHSVAPFVGQRATTLGGSGSGPFIGISWSKRPELYRCVTPDMLAGWVRSERQGRLLAELPACSMMIVPLRVDERPLGALVLFSGVERPFDEADLALASAIASRAALAIERALLHEALRTHADRMARLQSVTAAFAAARTPSEVAGVAVAQGVAAFGARTGALALLRDDEPVLDLVDLAGVGPDTGERWLVLALDVDCPLTEAVNVGVTIAYESVAALQGRFAASDIPISMNDRACITVPLRSQGSGGEGAHRREGRMLGALAFTFAEERRFTDADRRFVEAIAEPCAQALVRARLFEDAQRARSEAEAANRAKDIFLSTLSHELRTPLTAILGWASIARARRGDTPTIERALAIIERNATTQARLVEDILDVSRIVTGKLALSPRLVDLGAITRAAIEVVRPSIEGKGLLLREEIEAAGRPMGGDPERLQQVVWNLLSNAVKFTPRGGRIEVRVTHGPASARLSVTDSGEGITRDFLPHVFERFRQADATLTRSRGGLGLGLAIVKHIVDMHGGEIEVDSPGPGLGSTFTMVLPTPAAPADAGLSEAASVEPDSKRPTGSRLAGLLVLVVDDYADARELVAALLADEGAIVSTAASGAEAMRIAERVRFDVLISDIGMPDEDGYALLARLRERMAEAGAVLPAVALTGFTGEEDVKWAGRAGFGAHLAKPVTSEKLVTAVLRVVGRA